MKEMAPLMPTDNTYSERGRKYNEAPKPNTNPNDYLDISGTNESIAKKNRIQLFSRKDDPRYHHQENNDWMRVDKYRW